MQDGACTRVYMYVRARRGLIDGQSGIEAGTNGGENVGGHNRGIATEEKLRGSNLTNTLTCLSLLSCSLFLLESRAIDSPAPFRFVLGGTWAPFWGCSFPERDDRDLLKLPQRQPRIFSATFPS